MYRLCKSFCIICVSFSSLVPRRIWVSSAKYDTVESDISLSISDICIGNRRGPNTDIWRLLTWALLDVVHKKMCIHTQILPSIPIFLRLFIIMPWSTLSNAFAKPSRKHSHCLTFPITLISCCHAPCSSWERENLPERKPWIMGFFFWWVSRNWLISVANIFLLNVMYFYTLFYKMWCKGYGIVVLGKVPVATFVHWCNNYNGSFKIYRYFAGTIYTAVGEGGQGFRCIVWEVMMEIHQDVQKSFLRLFFSCQAMMSSLVILISKSGFTCGCPKKSFGYFIIIVGSGVLKTL